jgi:ABC-2 type transport system permease protein
MVARDSNIGQQPYIIFLITGLLPWNWIATSMQDSTTLFESDAQVIKSRSVNLNYWIWKTIIGRLISYIITLPIIFFVSSLFLDLQYITILKMFFAILFSFVFLIPICTLISVIVLRLPDVKNLLTIMLIFLRYLAPILYSVQDIPEKYLFIYKLNPFYYPIQLYRNTFWETELINFNSFAAVLIICLILSVISYAYLKINHNRIIEQI